MLVGRYGVLLLSSLDLVGTVFWKKESRSTTVLGRNVKTVLLKTNIIRIVPFFQDEKRYIVYLRRRVRPHFGVLLQYPMNFRSGFRFYGRVSGFLSAGMWRRG